MDVDSIDYSRSEFDEVWAYAANAALDHNSLEMVKCLSEMDTLLAVAQLEANHEYAVRLANIVEPIDNPQF